MELIQPIYYQEPEPPLIKEENIGLHFNFTDDDTISSGVLPGEEVSSKRARRSKSSDVNSSKMITGESDRELSTLESNEPYSKKYEETTGILKGAILQLDVGLAEMKKDTDLIRASKTLKGKYQYLSLIQGTMGTFIGNKISAARELNSTITKCNELELKRTKELHLADAQDDDKMIADMYNAFINTPVGNGRGTIGPSTLDMTLPSNKLIGTDIGGNSADLGYQNYINNMTPSQHMMSLEKDPDVKQVVFYDQSNGRRWFDVIRMSTGESVPNVEKKDSMFLEDTTIDVKTRTARNINLNESYPLIVVGEPILNEY